MIPIDNLDELKKIELSIMKKVHAFCVEKEIKYVLAYGTLLGAVRHNGFIPWDDDIDIEMPRLDYERFMNEFPEWEGGKGLEIVGVHTSGNIFPRDIIKVCDTRTLLQEKNYKNKCRLGVYIDVWPLDNVPDKLSFADRIWMKKTRFFRQISLASDIRRNTAVYKSLSFPKRFFITLFNHFNSTKMCLKQERYARKYRALTDGNHLSFSVQKLVTKKREDLFPSVLHKFEDTEFFIPNNYDVILSNYYGNYMTPPPPEQQKPHHIQDVYWK